MRISLRPGAGTAGRGDPISITSTSEAVPLVTSDAADTTSDATASFSEYAQTARLV